MARVAHSLNVLLAEINAAWPGRNTASDGAMGDAAHAARKSDHNPDGRGVIKARDYDITSLSHDAALALAAAIRAAMIRRFQTGYVIFDGRICNSDVQGWSWHGYDGPSPHEHHIHVSVHSLIDTTDAWDITPTDEGIDPMITLKDITAAVWGAQTGRGDNVAAMSLRVARAERDAAATLELVKQVAAKVGVTDEKVDEILSAVTVDEVA